MRLSNTQTLTAYTEVKTSPRLHIAGLRVLTYVLFVVLALVMLLPFWWMLSTSLKTHQYILHTPPELIPNPLSFESYSQLAEVVNLGRTFFNSLFVAVMGTAGR